MKKYTLKFVSQPETRQRPPIHCAIVMVQLIEVMQSVISAILHKPSGSPLRTAWVVTRNGWPFTYINLLEQEETGTI